MAAAAGILAALSAAAPIAGAAGGWSASAGDRESAEEYRKRMGIDLGVADPDITAAEAQQVGGTNYDNIRVDPEVRNAQLSALRQLQAEGLSGGLSPQDRARQAEALQTSQAAARGQREAILSQMAARGMGGSGAELAAQLANQQASAQQMNTAGLQTGADANARALAAIAQTGQLGGQMEGQQYNEAAQRAQAQDLINRYNASQRWDAQMANQQAQQQSFQNRLGRAQGYGAASGLAQDAANATMGTWAGVGQGVGQAFGAGAQFMGGKGGK